MSRILDRIRKRVGVDLPSLLGRTLSGSELKSVQLAVARVKAEKRSPASLLTALKGVAAPSTVDQRRLHELDGWMYQSLPPEFEAIELSPVAPIGVCGALGATPQDNVLSATRGQELLGDPTAVMAVESARRIRSGQERVHLCTSVRTVRMQPLQSEKHTPHFRLFAMTSAGKDEGSDRFLCGNMRAHIEVYLRFFSALCEAGYAVGRIKVRVAEPSISIALAKAQGVDLLESPVMTPLEGVSSDVARIEDIESMLPLTNVQRVRLENFQSRILSPLKERYPTVTFSFDPSRTRQATYYEQGCFHVVIDGFGAEVAIADGGLTGWTGKVLGHRKFKTFTSGLGMEMIAKGLTRA